ncbi:hypothetical protein Tco_0313090 [Tanacetum coccineum]
MAVCPRRRFAIGGGGELPGGELPGGELPSGELPGGELPGGGLPNIAADFTKASTYFIIVTFFYFLSIDDLLERKQLMSDGLGFIKFSSCQGVVDEDLEYLSLKGALLSVVFGVSHQVIMTIADRIRDKDTSQSKQNLQSSSMTFIHKTLIIPSVLDSCFISSMVSEVKRGEVVYTTSLRMVCEVFCKHEKNRC